MLCNLALTISVYCYVFMMFRYAISVKVKLKLTKWPYLPPKLATNFAGMQLVSYARPVGNCWSTYVTVTKMTPSTVSDTMLNQFGQGVQHVMR